MDWRWLLTILYGMLVIWTGLLRSIDAQAFKPNAFYFCLATGLIAIAAGYFYRTGMAWVGTIVALLAVAPVLSFYLYCFVTDPEADANHRVGLVILASIAQLCVVTIPRSPAERTSP